MAWTVTQTIDDIYPICAPMGSEMVLVKLSCVSDANATTTPIASDILESIKGGWLYGVKIVPGTGDDAPSAAFDFDIQDNDGLAWVDANSVSETAPSWESGADDVGVFPIVQKGCKFVCGTLGNANTAVFYIYVMRG